MLVSALIAVTRVTNVKQYEMTLGGESTGGDLVVARCLLVASLSGGEVTINLSLALRFM